MLFIFDWDGTLMDSTYQITSALQKAFRDVGLEAPDTDKARWVIGMSLHQALYHIAPDLDPEIIPKIIEHYKIHFFHPDNELHLFSGVKEMLWDLKNQGALLAVATGKGRPGLNQVLTEQNLLELFDTTKTADETAPKPDPLMLEEILLELNTPLEQAIMIGDTSHDIHMAKAIKMKNVAVSYGAHDLHDIQSSDPDTIVDSVPALHQYLTSFIR
ncbi:HAD-IA family hydrolase [Basilea psittacipulmonis]|uniref:HAD family hydrolase n=1 Tax=Basilea psittacipulmonis DSM 24701 TaxID=1072685 RepID=A0A077DBV8_9BURK|nr:HAD-IA family hydrolase [Basilea psittacipulmonis]AIL32144.1 hypothetical protein IX83_01325 [Basilea psittacipulmonis DSM 24701]